MPNDKLTYFNFDDGRGEPVRIALHAADIDLATSIINRQRPPI